MSLADTLKEATGEAHKSAESREMQRRLVRGALDEPRLAAYLARLHRLHTDLERRFDLHPEIAGTIGWPDDFRHSARLERDVAELGGDLLEPSPATDRALAEIDAAIAQEPASLLGFFYVLEGSMNGNRFIVRALRETPAAARCRFAYFDPYEATQPDRWASFRAALDGAELTPGQVQAIVDAALHQFAAIAKISDEVMASEPAGAS